MDSVENALLHELVARQLHPVQEFLAGGTHPAIDGEDATGDRRGGHHAGHVLHRFHGEGGSHFTGGEFFRHEQDPLTNPQHMANKQPGTLICLFNVRGVLAQLSVHAFDGKEFAEPDFICHPRRDLFN